MSAPTYITYTDGIYRTAPARVSLAARAFPELSFYSRLLATTLRGGARAKRGRYGDREWCQSSLEILRALECIGIDIEIRGIENIQRLDRPSVVIANHMSVLETMVLPVVIQPIRKVTFIVKDSLVAYPVFKHIMRSRDPIVVGRTNARQDLRTVLEGGLERLKKGISIIVFPQTTRTRTFDPKKFNTIGIKLAQRAKVPVVPLALSTDAWGNGKYLKDFGKIDPSRKVNFAFGEPMAIDGRGAHEHQAVKDFIRKHLKEWRAIERSDFSRNHQQ